MNTQAYAAAAQKMREAEDLHQLAVEQDDAEMFALSQTMFDEASTALREADAAEEDLE